MALPTEDWLCTKFEKMNLNAASGYPSPTMESTPLARDQFLRFNTGSGKWYAIHPPQSQETPGSGRVMFWPYQAAKLNAAFNRVARVDVQRRPPTSRPIPQEVLRKWERTARNNTYICNQAANITRGINKVQENMRTQFNIVRRFAPYQADSADAIRELRNLMNFHESLSLSLQRSLQDLTDASFVSLGNLILLRRDSYLDFLKHGVKQDTLTALRVSPLHTANLFADDLLAKAEVDITAQESRVPPSYPRDRNHPYRRGQHQQYRPKPKEKSASKKPSWGNLSKYQGKSDNCSRKDFKKNSKK